MKYSKLASTAGAKKQHTSLGLAALLCSLGVVACSDDGTKSSPSTDSTSDGSSGSSETAASSSSAGATGSTTSTAPNTGGTGGSGASSSTGTGGVDSLSTDTSSSGPTCTIASLAVFQRSDTEAEWDDNDFSDVTVEGSCPVILNVTWPHEEGWEDADPSEANHEQVRFTLDSSYSLSLEGKQLNLTIELLEDVRGPEATAGGYEVGLVSVSTFTRETLVPVEPASSDPASTDSVGTDSAGSESASSDPASSEPAVADAGIIVEEDASGDAGALEPDESTSGEVMTVTETGYAEAESPANERVILRHVGDRATVRFALPAKAAFDSYDPASVIKINARIYNIFSEPEPDVGQEPVGETSGETGETSSTSGELTSSAESSSSAAESSSSAATSASASESTSAPASGPKPIVYSYLTTKFAITDFTITDAE